MGTSKSVKVHGESTGAFRLDEGEGERGEHLECVVDMLIFLRVCRERCAGALPELFIEQVVDRGAYGNMIGGTKADLGDREFFDTARVR
jgi:hypothetical protein